MARVLKRERGRWRENLSAELNHRGLDPVSKILAWFDLLEEAISIPHDRGCIFINASIDYPGDRARIRGWE
ncbi:hypothetical protein [Mucisphaera calidilacus]|uniref:hypothetical protein n=1 Tax=Mucisphaera calidilacus TaxID=2527982 RepID=UPI001F489814|nr:hypothetical protein [Mucisphaera calidilacus]